MSRLIELNREFYDAMGFECPIEPTALDIQRRMQFMAYVISELTEFGNAPDIVGQLDALADVLYFLMDMFLEIGVSPERVHEIVHETNMAKLWDDGKPRIDHDVVPARLIKPPGWEPPTRRIEAYVDYLKDMTNRYADFKRRGVF